jgi:NADPH-dependent curcumin reductase CurA
VGSIVGQLAKADGLTVIGVVGSDEKADWSITELGYAGAVN